MEPTTNPDQEAQEALRKTIQTEAQFTRALLREEMSDLTKTIYRTFFAFLYGMLFVLCCAILASPGLLYMANSFWRGVIEGMNR